MERNGRFQRPLLSHGRTPTAGAAEPKQMTVRIGCALALAAVAGAPIRVTDQLMDQLAVATQSDLVNQFTRDVPLRRPHRGLPHLIRMGPLVTERR